MYTVEQVHADFYSAEERLLNEAKELLKDPQLKKAQYAERVSKLGFTSAKPVKEATDMAQAYLAAEERIKSIEYWRVYYPNHKFITEAEVKKLCEKYSLLLGDAGNYIGDIPEKNLNEIEAFSLRKEDWTEKTLPYGFASFFIDWHRAGLDPNPRPRSESVLSKYFSRVNRSFNNANSNGIIPMLSEFGNYAYGVDPYQKKDKVKKEQAAFKICAPKQDFNTAGFVVQDGYILVYDPIVLQPVKDGYLIVTAWGLEAADEIAVNQNNN